MKKKTTSAYVCEFCKASLTSENRLIAHSCEKKKRHLNKDDRDVRTGLLAYITFWQHNYPRTKLKTISDFINAKQYNDFVRFGRFINNNEIIKPKLFIEHAIKSGKPITSWYTDEMRNNFNREQCRHESHIDALERSFLVMEQWALKRNEQFFDFFRKIEPPLAVLWIQSGKISPWLIYTAESANELLSRLSAEQMNMILALIDPDFWNHKIKLNKKEANDIKEVLKEHGL